MHVVNIQTKENSSGLVQNKEAMRIIRHTTILCIFVIVFLFMAGCPLVHEVYADEYESLIPEEYQSAVCDACGVGSIEAITDAKAGEVQELSLVIEGKESLDFLRLFDNLESLTLDVETDDDKECLDTVPPIPSLRKLAIHANEDLEISSAANKQILQNNKMNIETLTLDGISLGPDVVEELENLMTLSLEVSLNHEIDYGSLNVQTLDLSWYGPYDVPIFLTYDDYQELDERGVEVIFSPYHEKKEYIQIWGKIEEIVRELNITDSEEETVLAEATAYTIERLNFDENIQNRLDNGEDVTDDIQHFYKAGNLYGVFNEETAICGNYAALLKALLEAADVESFYVINDDHAWNLAMVDETLGYVDATYIDDGEAWPVETIRDGQGASLDWYMEEVEDAPTVGPDDRQRPAVIPEYLVERTEQEALEDDTVQQTESQMGLGADSVETERELPVLPVLLFIVGSAICVAVVVGRQKKKPVQSIPEQSLPYTEGILYWTRMGKRATLGTKPCTIGSSKSGVSLHIPNNAISRIHAVIQWTDQGYVIRDMDSTNGTFVNGKRISREETSLNTGDIIQLANEEFVFRTDKKDESRDKYYEKGVK